MRTMHQASSGFKFHFSNLASFPNWKTGQLKSRAGWGKGCKEHLASIRLLSLLVC